MVKCSCWLAFLLFQLTAGYNGVSENDLESLYETGHGFRSLNLEKFSRLASASTGEKEYRALLMPLLEVRVPGTPGHDHVKDYIVNKLRLLSWDIEQDDFTDDTPIGPKAFTNIIATHNPSAPRRLSLACHYDSKLFENFEFQGMTDSAVPCSMLIDLAYKLNSSLWDQRDSKGSQISLQLIFFDGEEAFKSWTDRDSIYGARHLVKLMKERETKVMREVMQNDLERMDVLILLDLIGVADVKFRSWFQETDGLFERLKKTELRLVKGNHLKPETSFMNGHSKYFSNAQAGMGGVQDDHIPFLNEGVPVLHLIPARFPDVWHTRNDNIDHFDYTTVDNINKVLRIFVAEYLHIKNP